LRIELSDSVTTPKRFAEALPNEAATSADLASLVTETEAAIDAADETFRHATAQQVPAP
jgi:hypothetical protein